MLKKLLVLALAGILTQAFGGAPAFAGTQGGRESQSVEQQVRGKIARAGIGEKARVTVWLKDGTKIKGYISQVEDSNFVVRDRKTDAATTVLFNDVAKVDNNRGHSTARNIAIGVGIGAGVFLTVVLIAISSLD